MKKLIALILCLAMVTVLFVGCANDTESNSDPAPSSENTNTENEKLVIGVAYQDFTNEFTTELQIGVQNAAKELGVDLIEVDGKALAENQLSQVENFITQGVDGIILNP